MNNTKQNIHTERSRRLPQVRFPEFQDEWFEKQLSELLTFKNGLNASKEDYGSGYKFINVLDIINNDFINHDKIIGSVNVTEAEFQKNIVEYGDILFQRSSETREEVGQANVYLDKEVPATFGGFVIRGKKKSDYNPIFLNYLLKTSSARKDITSKSGGSTRYNVGQETLSSVTIDTTKIEEQTRIANFLTAVDKRINLLQKKKAKLEQYKKGVMQKLFSQTIRFKKDDSSDFADWEEKKLGEIADVYQPKTISQNQLTEEGFNVYGANGIIGKFSEYNHEKEQIAVTCRGNTCGTVNWTKPFSWITGNAMVINLDNNAEVVKWFMFYILLFSNLSYLITGSGQPQITGDIKNHKVQLSSFEEQQKIANALSTIDKSIEIMTKQIDDSVVFKQGLLQKMFV